MTRWLGLLCLGLAFAGCGSGSAAPAGSGGGGGCEKCAGGNGGTSGAAGSGGGAGQAGDAGSCGGADGIAVADVDLDGFPSYAVDGCRLLYVAAGSGELRLRSLGNGQEELVAPPSEAPRRPTLAGNVFSWEADENGKSVVRVRAGGPPVTLSGTFDHAGEPRATTDAVVFTAWNAPGDDTDSDVWVHTTSDGVSALVAGGAGQQRFADISPTHIAVSDFSEDPSGIYSGDGTSLANVIVVDRTTGKQTTRSLPGKQAFPMLGATGFLAYLEWLQVHPVPKLQDYTIQAVPMATLGATAQQIAHVQSDQAVRPTARDARVEWVVRFGTSSLWRAPLDGATPPSEIPLGNVAAMYAPAATSALTVLAVRQTSTAQPTLVSINE